MATDVLNRCLLVATPAHLHRLPRKVLEDVPGKIPKCLLGLIVENSRLILKASENLVINLAVLDLLDQTYGFTIHNIPGAQLALGEDETIHVVAVFAGCMKNEAVRPG